LNLGNPQFSKRYLVIQRADMELDSSPDRGLLCGYDNVRPLGILNPPSNEAHMNLLPPKLSRRTSLANLESMTDSVFRWCRLEMAKPVSATLRSMSRKALPAVIGIKE
jgi:hypothetical protein